MSAELKPCPFCGGEAVQGDHMLRVVCGSCGAAGATYTATLGEFQREHLAAARAWNTRATVEPAQAVPAGQPQPGSQP